MTAKGIMETTQTPRAIPTTYHGQRFRSKLEAKWALVFDDLQVPWDYEPEARTTQHGAYLPDFFLPRMGEGGLFFEVKPVVMLGEEDPRWVDFAVQAKRDLVVAYGLPDPYDDDNLAEGKEGSCVRCFARTSEIDHGYRLTMCAVCGVVGFAFQGRGARVCRSRVRCYGRPDADRAFNAHDSRIMRALITARAAFCGQVPAASRRTLPDARVDALAQAIEAERQAGRSVTGALDALRLDAGDREAVLLAWGRLAD